jgi:environmental stress-induced protein Ves
LKIINKHEQKTTLWSGGKTTELFIYPEDSSYAERNFQFRISTATVETETSEFTHLPGFKRHLMILDGELKIYHKHHHQKTLYQFDVDEFMGNWETTAQGKVVDFNLMHNENWKGKLVVIQLEKNKIHTLSTDSDFTAFYILNESVNIDNLEFQKGDFIITTHKKSCSIFSQEKANIIIINLNPLKL